MYYADYHMHSTCSPDAFNTMSEMAAASANYGLSEICFTDHCDMIDPELNILKSWSWEKVKSQYAQALLSCGRDIKIKLGVELGGAQQNPALADMIAADKDLDFVIGSVHVIPDVGDLYYLEYKDPAQCRELISKYIDQLELTVKCGNFDVLGHLTYPLRYIHRAGIEMDFSDFEERIEAIYRYIIQNGKGIELNTSNLKNGGQTMPDIAMLELYRKCGGEIITLGSDSHRTESAGSGIPHGYDILGYCGFKYFTIYNRRTPEFIKL